jgi:hypothetical protein
MFDIGGNSLRYTLNTLLNLENKDREQSDKLQSIIDFLREVNKAIDKEIPKKERQAYKNPSGMYMYTAFQRVFPGFSKDDYEKWYSANWNSIEKILLAPLPFKVPAVFKSFKGIEELFPDYFDTGGYTGKWNSKQGKLAVLHEKELVLNKDDTENMLKMLEFSRTMSELVQNNVLATLNSQKQYLNSIQ